MLVKSYFTGTRIWCGKIDVCKKYKIFKNKDVLNCHRCKKQLQIHYTTCRCSSKENVACTVHITKSSCLLKFDSKFHHQHKEKSRLKTFTSMISQRSYNYCTAIKDVGNIVNKFMTRTAGKLDRIYLLEYGTNIILFGNVKFVTTHINESGTKHKRKKSFVACEKRVNITKNRTFEVTAFDQQTSNSGLIRSQSPDFFAGCRRREAVEHVVVARSRSVALVPEAPEEVCVGLSTEIPVQVVIVERIAPRAQNPSPAHAGRW